MTSYGTYKPHQLEDEPVVYPGVTPPISLSHPTTKEKEAADALIKTLQDLGQYESEQDAQKREVVLGKLNDIVKQFVLNVSLRKGLPESVAVEAGGKIFTFGSYRLGVHGKGADIDTLCVAPKHVQREDFFQEMTELLKARPEVTELTGVEDAYVPVIKFEFSGIPASRIDLVFARLSLPTVPEELDISDDKLLSNLDDRCVRSLNGSRVTDEILRLVPNIPNFRTALRFIKLWAKRRGIYSNVLGFFGGVAWAMVTARVCQLYPNASSASIVAKFFRIMCAWNWPQPVLLKPISDGPMHAKVWNPKVYPADRLHRMPVITPAFPSMCSTHNVTSSTQAVMTHEFTRAADIADRIMIGKVGWLELIEGDDFFYLYKYYLEIIVSSNDNEKQLKWSGLVESKLRQVVMKLEMLDNLELAHPHIKSFDASHVCYTEQERKKCAHGEFPPKRSPDDPEQKEATELSTVYTTMFFIGLKTKKDPNNPSAPKKLDISWPVAQFTDLVYKWDGYDETSMGLSIQLIKSSMLPADVLPNGPRPTKKRQKSIKNTAKAGSGNEEESLAKKRRNSLTGPDTPMATSDELVPEETASGVEAGESTLETSLDAASKDQDNQESMASETTEAPAVAYQYKAPQTYAGVSAMGLGKPSTGFKFKMMSKPQ